MRARMAVALHTLFLSKCVSCCDCSVKKNIIYDPWQEENEGSCHLYLGKTYGPGKEISSRNDSKLAMFKKM